MPRRTLNTGFTLVEIAVVLFIVSLLIAGLVGPLATQLEARDRQRTIETMSDVVEALYGYALTNGRLPCPDSDGDGLSDPPFVPGSVASATCDPTGRFLPWAELGVGRGDAWGNRFTYSVRNPHFTWPEQDGICDGNTAPPEFDLCTTGDILVDTRGDDPAESGIQGKALITAANNLPAVIISHGRNGFGATSVDGSARPTAPASNADELENTNGDTTYMSRIYSRDQAGCADDTNENAPLCAFDDLLAWLSPAILNNRLVVAGRLP